MKSNRKRGPGLPILQSQICINSESGAASYGLSATPERVAVRVRSGSVRGESA